MRWRQSGGLPRSLWCTGAVGMMGKSWGGFNALQVAARRPPALKAVITFCSTDDRYADDVHYMGGCHLAENLEWGSVFFAYLPRPPDPQLVGERWRDMWRERLENVAAAARNLAPAPAPRCVLEARLGLRGLLAHRLCGLCGGRLGGRLLQRDLPPHGAPRLAPQGPHRSMGPPLRAGRGAGSRDRLPPGGGALVGPLAQGRSQRNHGRAHAASVEAGRAWRPRGIWR